METKQIIDILGFAAAFLADPAKYTSCRIAGITDAVEAVTAANIPVDGRDTSAARLSLVGAVSKGFQMAGQTRQNGNWERLFDVWTKHAADLFPDLKADPLACTRKQALAVLYTAIARLDPHDEALQEAAPPPPAPAPAAIAAPPLVPTPPAKPAGLRLSTTPGPK